MDAFLQLIPRCLDAPDDPDAPKVFVRQRKLTLPVLFTFLLSLVASGKHHGVDGKSGAFFRQARRSGLWPEAEAVHRSAITKARAKLPWTEFERMHHEAVRLAYDVWPSTDDCSWQGLSVFAVDGSTYQLPASAALRKAFDPESGFDHTGKGHYPQCLVSTAYDVFRRIPVARTVQPIGAANERQEAKALLPHMPANSVVLFDRGYPGYAFFDHLREHYAGYWVVRSPASSTFSAVEAFVQSGQTEAMLTLSPPKAKPFTVRAIRLASPTGEISVLLTNLPDDSRFRADSIIALYFRRWAIEVHYRDEKTSLHIETFHSQSENGIRQELFAILIMTVIARVLIVLTAEPNHPSSAKPQFKHAMITLANDAAFLAPRCPQLALVIFSEVLKEIARVCYYPPLSPRPPQPRISKQPVNKWRLGRKKQGSAS